MLPDLVSVVIACHNGLSTLDVQLVALAMQDYQGGFEVVISDNGSTDGLRAHIERHPLHARLNLRWVDSADRRGTPHARNVGVRAAKGDLLLITDQDDRAHPRWISEMVAAAAQYDAVSGTLEVESLNSPRVAAWRPLPDPERPYAMHFLPIAFGNSFAAWRTTLDAIDGYDETLTGGAEDLDISWRIQQAGMSLGHAPKAVMAYRLRSSHRETWHQAVGYGRTTSQAYLKHRAHGASHTPTALMVLAVPVMLLALPLQIRSRWRGRWIFQFGWLIGAIGHRVAARRW
jgi:GT2 family glycosyltransferase